MCESFVKEHGMRAGKVTVNIYLSVQHVYEVWWCVSATAETKYFMSSDNYNWISLRNRYEMLGCVKSLFGIDYHRSSPEDYPWSSSRITFGPH